MALETQNVGTRPVKEKMHLISVELPPKTGNIIKDIKQLVKNFISSNNFYIFSSEGNVKPTCSHINNGYCKVFAEHLIKMYPEATFRFEEHNQRIHAFIEYDGLFYDADSKKGVSNWQELKTFAKE